jgi:putative holliday junction resolvase
VKILAIDFGTKRIGLALSEETQTLAREFGILSPKEFWRKLAGILAEEEVERILIGLPLNMSGEETGKTKEAKAFAKQVESKVDIPVELVDERLSSQMAQTISGSSQNIDSLAAQIFLQNYLDKNKN